MSPPTRALLVCVLFLCGLRDAALALSGHCAGNRCVVLYRESRDFQGARKACSGSGGELLTIRSAQVKETLAGPLGGHSGSYWLDLRTVGGRAQPGNCSSVSVSGGGNIAVSAKQCRDELDGLLCQFPFQEPCSRIKVDGGAQVRYTAHAGFEVNDSEVFPPGTIAVVGTVDVNYLGSKHLCFSSAWMVAPWNCEVMGGGCEHSCVPTTQTCGCPEGRALHPNNVTCAKEPSSGCRWDVVSNACVCAGGYRLEGNRCVDVDECGEGDDPCTGEGEECFNTQGGFECRCSDGFVEEGGACVDVAICRTCEHMCVRPAGVYECACMEGFRVSAKDPSKCLQHCTERDCEAVCVVVKDKSDCNCPEGYIQDVRNGTALCTDIDECAMSQLCSHTCENSFGGFRCSCPEGFRLHDEYSCEPTDEGGSGDPPPLWPTPAVVHPAAVPPYVKTGSVLGIAVFMALCALLLCLVARAMARRCGRFELSSFRHPDIDVFYLQQVTTDTYKRLSFDKQFKSELQRQ